MGSKNITVGAVSANIQHNKQANLKLMKDQIQAAAAQQVVFLVFPELALQGGLFELNRGFDTEEFSYHWSNAETIPGESTAYIQELASQYQIHVNFGMFEKQTKQFGALLFNSSVLVAPDGDITVYRKIHQPIEEQIFYTPGNQWYVAQSEIGKVGLMICYDQNFPEAARELTLRGAEVFSVPSAWAIIDEQSADRYELFGRARALENNRWLIQSNQVGKSDTSDLEYLGHSRIIDPDGIVVASTPIGEEGMAVAEIQLATHFPARANTRWYLSQRKPKLYQHISQDASDMFDT